MTSQLVNGGFALGGAVVGLAGALLAQVFQGKRDRKNDERAVRNRKADRLRESYAALLLAVAEREAAAERWRWLAHDLKKLTAEERDVQVKKLMDEARIDIDHAQVALLLESETHGGAVLEIFRAFNNTLTDTFSQVMSNIMESDPQPLGPLLGQARGTRKKLEETAREHLAELEQPI